MSKLLKLTSMLFLAYPSLAHAELTKLPAGDVTEELTCEQAAAGYSEIQAGTASPDRIIAVLAALNKCGATAYNKAQAANGSDERAVVTAEVQGNGASRKVLFNLVTMNPKDIETVRGVCGAAAKAAGATFGDPITAPVLSIAGEYSCGAYVDAAITNNKLLLFAPTLIPGISITKDVLRVAGVSDTDIRHAEQLIDRTAGAGSDVARGSVTVLTGGTVRIDRHWRCVRVFGKKVCR